MFGLSVTRYDHENEQDWKLMTKKEEEVIGLMNLSANS